MGSSSLRIVVLADDYAGYEARGLVAQHGFSVLLEVDGSWVLFDTGQWGGGLIRNASILGFDLGKIGVIVLSHHHYDHTGGLLEVLEAVGRKRVPIVAHPDLFSPSIFIKENKVRLDIGIPFSRRELEKAGGYFLLSKDVLQVAPNVYFLGEIPREYADLAPGLPGNYTLSSGGELVEHSLLDDTGIAVSVEGLGLIVIGGCSHSGIANIALRASKVFKENVYAVIGGFHLISAPQGIIERTIKALKELGVEEVYPGHCTGLRAEYAFWESFGNRFNKIHAGFHKVFGAPS